MALGIAGLIGSGASIANGPSAANERARATLAEAELPPPLIERVLAARDYPDDIVDELPARQVDAVRLARTQIHMAGLSRGAGVIAGGLSLFVTVGSLVAGLLGWLLVMKKRVLQCDDCGAVTPAS